MRSALKRKNVCRYILEKTGVVLYKDHGRPTAQDKVLDLQAADYVDIV